MRAFGAPRRRFSRYVARAARARDQPGGAPARTLSRKAALWAVWALLLAFAAYILYASYRTVVSQSAAEWHTLLASTPYLLLAMGVDYLRVGLVTLATVGVAITLGYYLATHRRASTVVSPVIQVIAAFPARSTAAGPDLRSESSGPPSGGTTT